MIIPKIEITCIGRSVKKNISTVLCNYLADIREEERMNERTRIRILQKIFTITEALVGEVDFKKCGVTDAALSEGSPDYLISVSQNCKRQNIS